MPAGASQVDVQAPPGLEAFGGSEAAAATPDLELHRIEDQDVKEDLVREVAQVVRDHVEQKTATAIETIWKKGQKAMQSLQQQQLSQTQRLQSQLEACTEAHRQLERENVLLRQGLDSLMNNISAAFGAPPPPYFPTNTAAAAASAAPAAGTTPKASAASVAAAAQANAQAMPAAGRRSPAPADADSKDNPTASAEAESAPAEENEESDAETTGDKAASEREEQNAVAQPDTPSSVSLPSSPSGIGVFTFSLTLRRADNVPLGLEVRDGGEGDLEGRHLNVVAVRSGGAVEAWNRQCAGDSREIRAGDVITNINGAEDADSMRQECITKHLLKMTVVRGGSAATAGASSVGLRADAEEFVPSARG